MEDILVSCPSQGPVSIRLALVRLFWGLYLETGERKFLRLIEDSNKETQLSLELEEAVDAEAIY